MKQDSTQFSIQKMLLIVDVLHEFGEFMLFEKKKSSIKHEPLRDVQPAEEMQGFLEGKCDPPN